MARLQSLHHIAESSPFSLPTPIKGWNLFSSCLSHGIQVSLSHNNNVEAKRTEGDNRSTETEGMALHVTYMYVIFWWHFFAVFILTTNLGLCEQQDDKIFFVPKKKKKIVCKETVVLHQCERKIWKFLLSNELIKLELPAWRIWKADVLSVLSP